MKRAWNDSEESPQRRIKFSLAKLLCLFGVVAMVCYFGAAYNKMRRTDFHVQQLEKYGGFSNRPMFELKPLRFFGNVDDKRIVFFKDDYGTNISIADVDLDNIALSLNAIPTLEEVFFHENFNLEQIKRLDSLLAKNLILYYGDFNDEEPTKFERRRE